MDPIRVRKLEQEIEEAIAVIVLRRSKGRDMPVPPTPRTMQLMARAAAAVYEAVADQQGRRPED